MYWFRHVSRLHSRAAAWYPRRHRGQSAAQPLGPGQYRRSVPISVSVRAARAVVLVRRGRRSCGSLGGGRFTRLSPHSLVILRRFGRFVPFLAGVAALPLPSLRLWRRLISSGVRSRCCRLAVSDGPPCRLSLLLLGVFGGLA